MKTHLDRLRQLSIDLSQATTMEDVLWTLARSTMSSLGYEDCVIYVADPTTRTLHQRAAHGPKSAGGSEVVAPLTLRYGEGIVGDCAATQEPLLVANTREDPRYIADGISSGSELAVPVLDQGQLIAVIDSEHSSTDFFDLEDLSSVVDIAALAAARLRAAVTMEALDDSVRQLEAAHRDLAAVAHRDPLTNLLNRRGFEAELESPTFAERLTVALLDIDEFKMINDTHGHLAGDSVLRAVAEILDAVAKPMGLIAARLGGDEFAIAGAGFDVVREAAVKLRDRLSRTPLPLDATSVFATVSVGVASSTERRALRDDSVWIRGDEALFIAKNNGRDQLVVFDAGDPRLIALNSDRSWAQRVTDAMANNSLVLFGQPIVPCQRPTDPPQCLEALLRYQNPEGTIVTPDNFIGAIERFRMGEQLDTRVTRSVIEWLAGCSAATRAAINVSAQFVDSPRALAHLSKCLESTGVDPSRITIEIIETVAISEVDRCKDFIRTVRGWGSKVAIDDFGNGWTSIPLVRDLNVDILKIDGSWVAQATTDRLARSVVNAIVEAAKIIGVETVAEWVEDTETLRLMQNKGVDYVQGFLTGRPQRLCEEDPAICLCSQHRRIKAGERAKDGRSHTLNYDLAVGDSVT